MSMLTVIIGAGSAQVLLSQPLPYALQGHHVSSFLKTNNTFLGNKKNLFFTTPT